MQKNDVTAHGYGDRRGVEGVAEVGGLRLEGLRQVGRPVPQPGRV